MNRTEFLSTFTPLCRAYGEHYGIPWEIILAQLATESGWGKKPAPGTKLNFCGMKWTKHQWKRPAREVNALEGQNTGNERLEKARFTEFVSPEHCVGYLAETLAFSSHYGDFRTYLRYAKKEDRQRSALVALAKSYCSDRKYADTLESVMHTIDRELSQLNPEEFA